MTLSYPHHSHHFKKQKNDKKSVSTYTQVNSKRRIRGGEERKEKPTKNKREKESKEGAPNKDGLVLSLFLQASIRALGDSEDVRRRRVQIGTKLVVAADVGESVDGEGTVRVHRDENVANVGLKTRSGKTKARRVRPKK